MEHRQKKYMSKILGEKSLTLKELIEQRDQGTLNNKTTILDIESGRYESLSNILKANSTGKKVQDKKLPIQNATIIKSSLSTLLSTSVSSIISKKSSLLKVMAVPIIIFIIYAMLFFRVIRTGPGIEPFMLALFIAMCITTMFAIYSIHKVFLSDYHPNTIFSIFVVDMPLLKYIIYFIVIGIITGTIVSLNIFLIKNIISTDSLSFLWHLPHFIMIGLVIILSIPSLYVSARLIVSLPAIVANKTGALLHTWIITGGFGLRLLFLFGTLPIVLTFVVLLDFSGNHSFLVLLFAIFIYLCLLMEIAIITIVYRQLNQYYSDATH